MTQSHRIVLVAEWMANNGGSIADCSRAVGIEYEQAKWAWRRIKARLGMERCL